MRFDKHKIVILFGCWILSVLGLAFFDTKVASAAIAETDPVYQKVFYSGVLTCFAQNADNGGLKSEITLGEFDGSVTSLTNNYGFGASVYAENPVKVIGMANLAKISCEDLLANRVEKKIPTSPTPDTVKKEQILIDANYRKEIKTTNSSDEICYTFDFIAEYSPKKGEGKKFEGYSTPVCASKKNNKIRVVEEDRSGLFEFNAFLGLAPISFSGYDVSDDGKSFDPFGEKEFVLSDYPDESHFFAAIGNYLADEQGTTKEVAEAKDKSKENRNAYTKNISGDRAWLYMACPSFKAMGDNSGVECQANSKYTRSFGGSREEIFKKPDVEIVSEYEFPPVYLEEAEQNSDEIVFNFSNGAYSYDGLRFNDAEIYKLYQFYLNDMFGVVDINCGDVELHGQGEYRARLWWNEQSKYSEYCYFNVAEDKKDIKVYGIYDNDMFGAEVDLNGIIDKLNSLYLLSDDPGSEFTTPPSTSSQPSCYDGSGPLGWILCPVIQSVSTIGTTMWKSIEKNHLQVPAGEIFGNNSGVRDAWGIIRDIANILFIVLFLAVIFSQLTGVGIDNYGIKKILPRLIVVAVLINLSYIICELAIDLSNILGNGLNSILSDAANNVASGNGASLGSGITEWIFTAALGGGGAALFVFLNPAGALAGAAALGLAVLGVVISIVVALLILYAIVVARSAGIILLTVLAPAAIVCYALPNTEKLAKKWFDIFKALLVVYPICGAMVGAGRMAGAVLSGINNGSMKVAAMVVQVLPFFLIPTLLKSSLALMGNLGAKISNLGRQGKQLGAKGFAKAQGAVKGTEQFKNWSQYQQEKTAANRAGRVQARLRNRMASGKTLSTREQDKLRRADDTVLAWQSREEVNARRTSEQSYAAREAAIETENEKAKVADYESLLENGRAFEADGVTAVNINDPNSVGRYHAEALARYEAATSDAERGEAMSQIKAAQNILSKTDKGRAQVQNNLEAALAGGRVAGLSGASAHLMSNFGDAYKNKNRGAHEMIRDLATTDLSKSAALTGLQSKLTNGDYAFAGTGKYTAESLAGADDAALDRFVDGVNNGKLTGNELADIQATAYEALQKSKNGTLNIKPEVSQKLEQIVGSNYVPKAVPNDRATILSHGAYEFYDGTVVHLRELSNGKYLDDAGNETDIRFYKRKL